MITEDARFLDTAAAIHAEVTADSGFTDDASSFYSRRTVVVAGKKIEISELLTPNEIDWFGQQAAETRRRMIAAGYSPEGLMVALVEENGASRSILTIDASTPEGAVTYVLDRQSDAVLNWSDVPGIRYRENASHNTWVLVGA